MKGNLSALLFVLILFSYNSSSAQEMVIPDIDTTKYNGFVTGGGMESFMYVPYFITRDETANFVISQLNTETLIEEQMIPLELPKSYTLKSSGQSMGTYLLLFYDTDKKEYVLMTVVEKNIAKKETVNIKRDAYHILNTNIPEGFITLAINKKGFTLQKINLELETKWEKSIEPASGKDMEVINITGGLEGLNILYKEETDEGKYSFTTMILQPENGEAITKNTLMLGDVPAYPTFISVHEGMGIMGGYYFNDGKYRDKPDGIFMAMSSPEGDIEDYKKVPYSQIIEDLKNTAGGKLNDANTSIAFVDGMVAHGTQSMMMTGQIFTKKDVTGGAVINTADVATLKFHFEKGYKGANVTKLSNEKITINGDVTSAKIVDIGTHLAKSRLFPVQQYANVPDQAIIRYHMRDINNMIQACFKNAGLSADTSKEMCVPLGELPKSMPKYNYEDIKLPMVIPNTRYGSMTSPHDMDKVLTYELREGALFMRKTELPDIHMLAVMEEMQEEEEQPEDEMPEDEAQEDNDEAEGEEKLIEEDEQAE